MLWLSFLYFTGGKFEREQAEYRDLQARAHLQRCATHSILKYTMPTASSFQSMMTVLHHCSAKHSYGDQSSVKSQQEATRQNEYGPRGARGGRLPYGLSDSNERQEFVIRVYHLQ